MDYFISNASGEIQKGFSLISLILSMITFAPLWSETWFVFTISISVFLPFVFGFFGMVFGWFGIKGNLRISLIALNIVATFLYIILFLMATIGFNEP